MQQQQHQQLLTPSSIAMVILEQCWIDILHTRSRKPLTVRSVCYLRSINTFIVGGGDGKPGRTICEKGKLCGSGSDSLNEITSKLVTFHLIVGGDGRQQFNDLLLDHRHHQRMLPAITESTET